MWFLPSYGRPEALARMEQAPGGLPDKIIVLVNDDDPKKADYVRFTTANSNRWWTEIIPSGSRCSDAHRFITQKYPDLPFYGLLCDDQWPITPGWDKALVKAAGNKFFAVPAGEPHFPLIRTAFVVGGDLVRAMGTLVPAAVKHNYEDNIWDRIAADFKLLVPLPDVRVEHKHWLRGDAPKDATYERGSHDIDEDRKVFDAWLVSPERTAMCERIGLLLEVRSVTSLDPKKVRLAIVVPIGDEHIDVGYHKSLNATMVELNSRGIDLSIIESMGGSHVGKSRERVLWKAMRNNPTHIMWIDSDMGWEPSQIVRLLCADHEFSCIVGVRKTDELKVCCNFLPKEERHPVTNFLKIRDVGFAFVLMKVSVIEKMCKAYPELRYNAGDHAEWALFMDMIDKKQRSNGRYGERLSEDFSLCTRWRAIGGEIWCDDDAAISHFGRKEYTGKVSDVLPYVKPDATAPA